MRTVLNTIGESFAPAARVLLQGYSVQYSTPSQAQLSTVVATCDAVICGLGLNFDAHVISHAKHLKLIATATTGLDHIDLAAAAARGIRVVSLKDDRNLLDTVTGTAELALGLMIDLMRLTPFAFDDVRAGNWEREHFRGRTLSGKTLGIIGAGRLGSMVARYGQVLGMKVLFADPHVEVVAGSDARKVSVNELIAESDVISLHVHLSDETRRLINAEALSRMKRGAYLVNTSRGDIVDEMAVLAALETGRIAGYATDVLADETVRGGEVASHPLVVYAREHNNCIVTPHIGGMTYESREATDLCIAKKLVENLPL